MGHTRSLAEATSEFRWLQAGLDNWTKRVAQYAETWSSRNDDLRDAAYWHSERATASVLVAALAQTGADVLSEYTCERIEQGSTSRRGRTDIWCSEGSRDGTIIEAKQIWPDGRNVLKTELGKAFRAARAQLQSEHNLAPDTQRLSVVFAVPRILGEDHVEDPAAPFLEYLNTVAKKDVLCGAAGFAWCFPGNARQLRGVWAGAKGHVFPGVLAVVRREEPLGSGCHRG